MKVLLDRCMGRSTRIALERAGLIRLDKVPASLQAAACVRALDQHAEDLAAGAIITVERGRIRVRRPTLADGDHALEGDVR